MFFRVFSQTKATRYIKEVQSKRNSASLCPTGKGKYTDLTANRFAKEFTLNEGSLWLIYKHAELAIRKWVTLKEGSRALDWGCGAAKSTLWLKSVGLFDEVHGADLNDSMIQESRTRDPDGEYILALDGKLPSHIDLNYDLVLSISVVIEIPTRAAMRAYAAEAFRILRPGGLAVVTGATEESRDPANEYVSFSYLPTNPDTDPHNQHLKSGDPVVVLSRQGLALEDFVWTRQDYENTFTSEGFKVIEVTRTWGEQTDPFEWRDELRVPSDYVLVFQKPEGVSKGL